VLPSLARPLTRDDQVHPLVPAAAAPAAAHRAALLPRPLSLLPRHACPALVRLSPPARPPLSSPAPSFYCIILLTTLFISSCYWQPFPLDTPLSTPWSEDISTFADALNATLSSHYSLPQPTVIRAADRCWCDLTSGNFFEPFNVSQWECISVQRLKDSLEKKQKALLEHPQDSAESSEKLEDNPSLGAAQVSLLAQVWSALKDSIYTFSLRAPESGPQRSRLSRERRSVANTTRLPLIRSEYDLRPYGLNMVLDFAWSR
jgi:hypothetical protein